MAIEAVKKNSPAIASIIDRTNGYARASKANATHRGYAADLRDFAAYCQEHDLDVSPASPQAVAEYLTHLADTGKAVATIKRRCVSIGQAHKNAGYANPVADPFVRATMQGISRTIGTAQRKKTAITAELLPSILINIDTSTLKGKRDKAILLLTFFLAGRRSEVAALNVEDLRFVEKLGIVVNIRRSKTDQTGKGREIEVPEVDQEGVCAVKALKAWLLASGIKEGALFRSFSLAGKGKEHPLSKKRIAPEDVARIVQIVTEKAGLVGDFAGHSLRAGFITTAASTKGVTEVAIQGVSGHQNVPTLRGYIRKVKLFQDCPASAMFGKGLK